MNRILIGILLALATPLTVIAGEAPTTLPPTAESVPPPPEAEFAKHHGKKMEQVAKELGLNEDQKTKLKTIFEEQKVKLKAIHEETRSRLQSILTPEQFAKFESLHQDKHHPKPE